MRILILNHEYPPVGGGGGRACYETVGRLAFKGHRISVVTAGFSGLPAFERYAGVDVHRVYGCRGGALRNNPLVTAASFLTLGYRQAKHLIEAEPFDVIHSYFTLPAGFVGARLKKRLGLPLVVSLRGSDVPHHNPDEFNLPVRALAPLIRDTWRAADRVIAVSSSLRRTAHLTAPGIDIDTVPNGVDLVHFAPNTGPAETSTTELLTVSRLIKCKGIQHLLLALSELRRRGLSFRLRIAGDGNHRPTLEGMCQDLGLSTYVEFLGHVPHEDLPRLYGEAHAFVLPSLAESFGQVFAEAMACGLPVVGTTVGGIPEVVGTNYVGALAEPGSVPSLVDVLTPIIRDAARFRREGAKNAGDIGRRLSWDGVAQAYEDIYRQVAGPAPADTGDVEHDEERASIACAASAAL